MTAVENQPRWNAVLQAAARVKAEVAPDTLLAIDLPMDAPVPTGHASGLVEMATELPVLSVQRQGSFEYADAGPRTGQWSADELKGAGVTHLIATSPGSPVAPDMTLLQDYGQGVRLYALAPRAPDHRVRSEATITLGDLSTETVTLEGPIEGYTATLRMRYHPRWTAEDARVRVERSPHFDGARPIFTRITVPPGVGRVTLTYAAPPGWATGWLVTVLSVVVLGVMIRRRPTPISV